VRSLIPSLIERRASTSIIVYRRPMSSQKDPSGRACTVILNPEKRKVGGSTPPLTTVLTCADLCLVIVKAQLVALLVSLLGQLLQADGRPCRAWLQVTGLSGAVAALDERWVR
jgi:hypothetical protein